MSRLKKQNSFEDKIKKSLEDFETKPSNNLWDRIETNLNANSFENAIKQKIDDVSFTPNEFVWQQIENKLPVNKTKKRRFIFFTIIGFLLGAGFATGIYFFHQPELKTYSQTETSFSDKIFTSKSNTQNSLGKNIRSDKKEQNKIHNNNFSQKDKNKVVDKLNVKIKTTPVIGITTKNQKIINLSKNRVLAEPNAKYEAAINSNNLNFNDLKNEVESTTKPDVETKPDDYKKNILDLSADKNYNILNEIKAINNNDTTFVTKPATNVNNYLSPDENLSDFGISVFAGYQFTGIKTGLHQQNTALNKAFDLRKKMEKPSADWTFCFLADYYINQKLIVSSGIALNNIRLALTYNLTNPVLNNDSLRVQPSYAYMHGSDSIISGTSKNLENTFSFTEIPIRFTYITSAKNNVQFTINAGASYAMLSSVNIYVPDASCVGLLQIADKNQFPEYRNIIFVSGGAGVSYLLNQNISFGAEIFSKSSVNNMVKNKNWFKETPYMFGSTLFLRKRF